MNENAYVAAKLAACVSHYNPDLDVQLEGNVVIVKGRRIRVEFVKGRYRLYLRDGGPSVMFDLDPDRFISRALCWATL